MLNSSHPPALREIFAHSAVLLPRVLASLASLALVASALCAQPVHAQPVDAPLLRIDTGAHNAAIRALGIDAAGRYAVTASDDKTARVWDLASGRLLQTLRPPVGADNNGRLFAAAMTPDAATVAVGGWSADNDVYLFERASGTMIQRITGLPNTITQLAFAPDGKLLLIGLWGQHGVRLFGTSSGWRSSNEIDSDAKYQGEVYGAHFSADGKRLATASVDGAVRLYDLSQQRLKLVNSVRPAGGNQPFAVAYAPDGMLLAVSFADTSAVTVLLADTLQQAYVPSAAGIGNGSLNALAWSHDGRELMAAGTWKRADGQHGLRTWADRGRGAATDASVASDSVVALHALPDGRTVYAAADAAWGWVMSGAGQSGAGQPVRAKLQTVASGLTAPVDLEDAADGSGRLFVVEQTGKIKILQNGAILPTPFRDVTARLVPIMPDYDERGLLGLAFDSDFNNPAGVGYHRIYTYTSEPVSGKADFSVPDREPFDCQTVIAEWQVSAADPNVIDPATRREVMRIDKPQFNHNGGHLAFGGQDHLLYISLGDGGNANDVGAGHNARIGNGQDTTVVLGKMLRIDPRDPALTPGSAGRVSRNGKYRVPRSNPFFYRPPTVPEIFAYGLRNPYRFSFDALTDLLVIADVGQDNIEEVDIVGAGANCGWNRKEGSFLFDPKDGSIRNDRHPDPTLTEPVVEYSHQDGIATIGGFVYRGRLAAPVLKGQYVFGDLFGTASGRLFFSDLGAGTIFEFQIGADDESLGAFLKGFGQDAQKEIYVLSDTNIGPSGTGGEVRKIVSAAIIP